MTREVPNPITAVINGIAQLGLFMWLATRAALSKLLTPAKWNYREQARRAPEDVRKMRKAAPHVLKNAASNATNFFKIRGRGDDGPRE